MIPAKRLPSSTTTSLAESNVAPNIPVLMSPTRSAGWAVGTRDVACCAAVSSAASPRADRAAMSVSGKEMLASGGGLVATRDVPPSQARVVSDARRPPEWRTGGVDPRNAVEDARLACTAAPVSERQLQRAFGRRRREATGTFAPHQLVEPLTERFGVRTECAGARKVHFAVLIDRHENQPKVRFRPRHPANPGAVVSSNYGRSGADPLTGGASRAPSRQRVRRTTSRATPASARSRGSARR